MSYGGSGFICKPDGGVDVADEVKAELRKSTELKLRCKALNIVIRQWNMPNKQYNVELNIE